MKPENSTVQELLGQGAYLEEFARHVAQRMIAHATEAEVTMFMEKHRHIRTRESKAAVVRNGYLPERTITTSAGPIAVKMPCSRSSISSVKPFASALIPKYMRKNLNIEEAVPLFYLGGLSNNDFIPAFEKLFGELPAGFSSASISRMKKIWLDEHRKWNRRPMHVSSYSYLWVDGIHFNLRLDDGRLCAPVVIGAS